MTRRGAVLLVSISVLVVLALLATVFASMAEIERNISRNYVDDIRARMLAESGIQEAVSLLQQTMERGEDLNNNGILDTSFNRWENTNGNLVLDRTWPLVTTWWYFGEDRNANGILDPGEDRNRNGKLDTVTCPLEDALRPSFSYIDPVGATGRARQIFIQEPSGVRPTAVCGALSVSSYGKNADQYLLKIVDTSSQIYLNDRNPNLARILNNLSINLGGPPDLGNRIVAGRPPVGFNSKYDLLTRRLITPAEFDRVKDCITAFAWVDSRVVNPVPLSSAEHVRPHHLVKGNFGEYWRPTSTGSYKPGTKIYRYGPGFALPANVESTLSTGSRSQLRTMPVGPVSGPIPPECFVYGADELNPQWIETAARAPININMASKEVLMALIEGLDGFYLLERNRLASTNGTGSTAWTRMQEMPGIGFRRISTGGVPTGPSAPSPITPAGLGFGSEIGVLYRTGPILGPAGTSSTGARGTAGLNGKGLAEILARKIVEYRARTNILPGGSGNLPNVAEGPFLTWAQFNEFCDQLLLQDAEVRNNIMEGAAVSWPAGSVEWAAQAQARIDVLKANFNPNLHLNEANPDDYLWTWVDKTDLVVASTEFCFTPMGTFEIESLGRIYRPVPETSDATAAGTNVELLAEKKIVTNVQLYDAIRETSQKQFYGDSPENPRTPALFDRRDSTEDSRVLPKVTVSPITTTNTGYALQTYPEPENGDAPYDADYEGYVGLSTYGGYPAARSKHTVFTNLPIPDGSRSIRTTPRYATVASTVSATSSDYPPGSGGVRSPMMESARAHFDTDFNLHYSATQGTAYGSGGNTWYGERRVQIARRFERSQNLTNLEYWFNYPAPSETTNRNPSFANRNVFRLNNIRGPYCMSDLIDGRAAPNYDKITPKNREFRVCRSFRVATTASVTGSTSYTPRTSDSFFNNLPFHYYAPSGLRADGGYIERNNAPVWSPTRAKGIKDAPWSVNGPVNLYQGTASYWIKPNFFPDLAGKIRSFFSLASMRSRMTNTGNQRGFTNPNAFTHFFTPNYRPGGALPGPAGASYIYLGGTAGVGAGPARARSFLFGYGFDTPSGFKQRTGWVTRNALVERFPPSPPNPSSFPWPLQPPPCNGAQPFVAGTQSQSMNTIPASGQWNLNRYMTGESDRIFDARKWCHVVLTWRMYTPNSPGTVPNPACQIYINGQLSRSISFTQAAPPSAAGYAGGDPRLCNACNFCWDRSQGRPFVGTDSWDEPNENFTLHEPWNDIHPRHQAHFCYHWFWDKKGSYAHSTAPPERFPRNTAALEEWSPMSPSRWSNTPFDDWVNPLRIGEPTTLTPVNSSGSLVTRNHNPDSTIDEFWLWQYVDPTGLFAPEAPPEGGLAGGLTLWRQGRYYRENNGRFISQTLDMARPQGQRNLPPLTGTTSGTPGRLPPILDREIVGVAWTQMTKKFNSDPLARKPEPTWPGLNQHYQFDYQNPFPEQSPIPAGVELIISNNNGSSWYGQKGPISPSPTPPFTNRLRNAGWSVPFENDPPPPLIPQRVRLPIAPASDRNNAGKTRFKYQAFFRMRGVSPLNSILLETPVLDDVTIYFTIGRPQHLDWVVL